MLPPFISPQIPPAVESPDTVASTDARRMVASWQYPISPPVACTPVTVIEATEQLETAGARPERPMEEPPTKPPAYAFRLLTLPEADELVRLPPLMVRAP